MSNRVFNTDGKGLMYSSIIYTPVEIESAIFRENVKDLSRALEKEGRHSDAKAVRAAGKKVEARIK